MNVNSKRFFLFLISYVEEDAYSRRRSMFIICNMFKNERSIMIKKKRKESIAIKVHDTSINI